MMPSTPMLLICLVAATALGGVPPAEAQPAPMGSAGSAPYPCVVVDLTTTPPTYTITDCE